MKYLQLISVVVFFLTACDKNDSEDKKSCWECKDIVSSSTGYYSSTTSFVCDKTRAEIVEFMKAGTATTNEGSTGIRVSTQRKCEIER